MFYFVDSVMLFITLTEMPVIIASIAKHSLKLDHERPRNRTILKGYDI